MDTKLLMDSKRIETLEVNRTYYDIAGVRFWKFEPPTCAFKFLVIDGVLVIAPIGDHTDLYAAFKTWDEPVDEAKRKVREIAYWQYGSRNRRVSAAGEINPNGVVTGWKSIGFNVYTPDYMMPEIEAVIRQLYDSGALEIT